MTLEERITAAARCVPADMDMTTHAERILRAAFPELFTSPPQAWLAPVEATREMVRAMGEAPQMKIIEGVLTLHQTRTGRLLDGLGDTEEVSALAESYAAARDAHTKTEAG